MSTSEGGKDLYLSILRRNLVGRHLSRPINSEYYSSSKGNITIPELEGDINWNIFLTTDPNPNVLVSITAPTTVSNDLGIIFSWGTASKESFFVNRIRERVGTGKSAKYQTRQKLEVVYHSDEFPTGIHPITIEEIGTVEEIKAKMDQLKGTAPFEGFSPEQLANLRKLATLNPDEVDWLIAFTKAGRAQDTSFRLRE